MPHYAKTTGRGKRATFEYADSRFYERIDALAPADRRRGINFRIGMIHTSVTTPFPLGLRKSIVWMPIVTLVTVYALSTSQVRAQSPDQPTRDLVARLLSDVRVTAARQHLRRAEPSTLDTQVALCQIAAPPFREQARGQAVAALFRQAGLSRVRTDGVGNVLGDLAGHGAGPHVVISAHLDTVFPPGTDVTVRRQGSTLRGPGIGDDCRGLAVLVALARVAGAGLIAPDGPVTFVATVGEEGLGDLRGARHLLDHTEGINRFISLDGGGLSVVSKAVGSARYKVTFSGPGGHSYGNFGMANPIHAMGRAIDAIAEFRVPADPKTTFNVGRVGGGTSVNAIAARAWMEVDLRSSDGAALEELDRRFRAAVDAAVAAENQRWGGRAPVAATVERTGARPTGRTADSDPLVRATLALTESLGESVSLAEGSTDANVAMHRGIPAVTLGAGGVSRGAHSPEESFVATGSAVGTERALLVLLAAASGTP